jgi:hypothetical protein
MEQIQGDGAGADCMRWRRLLVVNEALRAGSERWSILRGWRRLRKVEQDRRGGAGSKGMEVVLQEVEQDPGSVERLSSGGAGCWGWIRLQEVEPRRWSRLKEVE